MKIVTVNVPEAYIDAMDKLIGEDNIHSSRSELIRVATREFLLQEVKILENTPIEKPEPKTCPYTIIRKLENPTEDIEDTPKKNFEHAKPKQFIHYTKDFALDLTLSLIHENPNITNERLAELTGYDPRVTRAHMLKAIKLGVPVQNHKSKIPKIRGNIWRYTLE